MTSKNTRSCGCLRKEPSRQLPFGEAAFNEFYNDYKRHSIKKGIVFEFSKKEFRKITQQPCYYCGKLPNHEYGTRNKSRNGPYLANGIDKKVPLLGYVKDNCVACCIECNFFKNNLTDKKFLSLINKIYKWKILNDK